MKLTCLVAIFIIISTQNKCYALTMEGGGTKGAYEAGVLYGLAYNLPPEQRGWQVISGISVGSITAIAIALFPPGQEKEAAEMIKTQWTQIEMSNIFKNWPLSILQGLFEESGLFDTTPERDFIASFACGKQIQRYLTIGMTDAQNGGEYVVTDKNFTAACDFVKYVVGSSAIPAIFPTLKIGDDVFVDGLAVNNLDIVSPINRCKDLGFQEEDIVIDIILTNSRKNLEKDISNETTITAYLRSQSISSFLEEFYYIDQVVSSHPNVDFRYLVFPTKKLPEYPGVPLNFNKKDLLTMHSMGVDDAKAAINAGKGKGVRSYLSSMKELLS